MAAPSIAPLRRPFIRPSYRSGFARNAGEALFPELWKNLIGAWCPALGPSGLKLMDLSGRGNDGTLTDMDPNTDWKVDQFGYKLDFDGVNDSVELGTPESLKPTKQITIAAWVEPTGFQTASGGRIISKSNGGTGDDWALSVLSSEKPKLRIDGTDFGAASNGETTQDEMNFIVGSYDGKQGRVYTNGIRATNSGSPTIPTTNPVSIGRNPSSADRFFVGNISCVLVWDTGIHDGAVYELERLGPTGIFIPKPRPAKVGVAAALTFNRHQLQGGKLALSGGKI